MVLRMCIMTAMYYECILAHHAGMGKQVVLDITVVICPILFSGKGPFCEYSSRLPITGTSTAIACLRGKRKEPLFRIT